MNLLSHCPRSDVETQLHEDLKLTEAEVLGAPALGCGCLYLAF